uniref:ORF8 n=1 Tax=Nitrosopumilaceae spindle-shaped virus TaxID=3065433 RepID=A0AAT9JHN9_9VIRU
MIDKSIMIIIFMYGASISFLTIEYVIVDVFHITVTNYAGQQLTGAFVTTQLNLEAFNLLSGEIQNGTYTPTNGTFYDKVETYATAGAAVAWNFITILSGLYVFNLLTFMGVPLPFVIGLAILYVFLLARTIIGLLQRI